MTSPRNLIAKHSQSGVIHYRAVPDSYHLWPACRTQATSGAYRLVDGDVTCRRCLRLGALSRIAVQLSNLQLMKGSA